MNLRTAFSLATFGIVVLPTSAHKSTFEGYKVYQIEVGSNHEASLKSRLQELPIIELSHSHGHGGASTLDIAVPPEHLEAFDALNFTAAILSEDLGADIAAEGPLGPYPGLIFSSWAFATSY